MTTNAPDEDGDCDLFTLLASLFAVIRRHMRGLKPSVLVVFLMCYLIFIFTNTNIVSLGRKSLKKPGVRSGAKGQSKLVADNEEESVILAEFGRRKKLIHDTCDRNGAYTTKEKLLAKLKLEGISEKERQGQESPEQLWNLLRKSSHHQFFVQKEEGLMWCKIPKAASTSWLHAYLTMAGVPDYLIPEDNEMGLHGLLRDKYPLLSKNLYKQYIPQCLKFMVVRHPFERVVSAYLDKLADYNRDLKYRGGYYYAMYGGDIVTRYREKYLEKYPKNQLFLKKEPSFIEFVNYLIDTPITSYDEHWKPQFLLCPPCHFKFDIIVKMDTFKRDTDFILKKKELEGVIFLEKKHTVSKKKKVQVDPKVELFSQLSKNLVKALYDKYRIDFEMFEYDIDDYISIARDSDDLLPDNLDPVE